jgi:hypothetical protein
MALWGKGGGGQARDWRGRFASGGGVASKSGPGAKLGGYARVDATRRGGGGKYAKRGTGVRAAGSAGARAMEAHKLTGLRPYVTGTREQAGVAAYRPAAMTTRLSMRGVEKRGTLGHQAAGVATRARMTRLPGGEWGHTGGAGTGQPVRWNRAYRLLQRLMP